MQFKFFDLANCKKVLFVIASTLMFSPAFAVVFVMLNSLGLRVAAHHMSGLIAAFDGFCLGIILGLVSSIYVLLRKSHLIKPYLIASSVFMGCVFLFSFIAVNFFGVSW